MPKYVYKASDWSGEVVESELTAESRTEAIAQIRQRGLTPVEVKESSGGTIRKKTKTKTKTKAAGKDLPEWLKISQTKKATPSDLAVFFRLLSISVSAGVSLRDAMENIAAEMENNTLKQALLLATEDLQGGQRFAEALGRNNIKKVFPPLALGLTKVAEETGTLGNTTSELACYLEDMIKMKNEISSKTSYPCFMLVAFTFIMLGCTFFLFPSFEKNFAGIGAKLPTLTQTVFSLNRLGLKIAPYALGLLGIAGASIAFWRSTPAGRIKFDELLLRIPLLGDVLYKIGTARFCRTLSITVQGGVPLLDGLEISSTVVGNKSLERHLEQVAERINNGQAFGRSVRETNAFTGLVVRMIEVGEESGQLPLVLDKVSEVYDDEINRSIKKLTSLIEPVIIVLFGVFVTVMVLALYMPIFSMSSSM